MRIKACYRERLLCAGAVYTLLYRGGCLIVRGTGNRDIVCKVRVHSRIGSIGILERLLRMMPRAAVSLDHDSFLISDHGRALRYEIPSNTIQEEHFFDKKMNNPLSFCQRCDADGKLIEVLYGEYIWNRERGPVSVYRRTDRGWQVAYSFPSNTVTHIHNIVYDRYRERYLIMTGDSDKESGIWEADLSFCHVEPIVRGQQRYRACLLMPTENCLYYVTDTPLEQNYVYRLDHDGSASLVSEVPGPAIYGIEKGEYLYFATSVEGNPMLGKWRYRFSDRLGRGVRDRYSHLFRLSRNGRLEEIGKMKKDWMPMWLFEFGNMKFPVSGDGNVYVCPQSLKARYGTYVLSE